jgi:hypothetical protein
MTVARSLRFSGGVGTRANIARFWERLKTFRLATADDGDPDIVVGRSGELDAFTMGSSPRRYFLASAEFTTVTRGWSTRSPSLSMRPLKRGMPIAFE